MQALKVMIASALVLVACTEGLPEGKSCYVKLFHILYMAVTAMVTNCSVLVCAMDKSFSSLSE